MESTRRTKEMAVVPLVFLLFFGFLLAVNCRQYGTTVFDVEDPMGFTAKASNVQGKEVSSLRDSSKVGSNPPNCTGKCGDCVPCVQVMVTVTTPPGSSPGNKFEYYPQGWACQCGNKLFVP